jgi:hypothetical protein
MLDKIPHFPKSKGDGERLGDIVGAVRRLLGEALGRSGVLEPWAGSVERLRGAVITRHFGHHTACNVDTRRSENTQTFDLPL